MTLSDLQRQDAKGHIFLADLHNYARTVTEFDAVTQVGEALRFERLVRWERLCVLRG